MSCAFHPKLSRGGLSSTDGECAFVARLRNALPAAPAGQHWIGDDAAVLDDGLLLKTDILVEGVHFDLRLCDPEDVGWKALAVNLSGAAMGGAPTAAVVALVVPPDRPGMADRTMTGLVSAAERLDGPIVGGDTSSGPALTVAVAVLGQAPEAGPVLRSGAQPDDIILVTGELGAAASPCRRTPRKGCAWWTPATASPRASFGRRSRRRAARRDRDDRPLRRPGDRPGLCLRGVRA